MDWWKIPFPWCPQVKINVLNGKRHWGQRSHLVIYGYGGWLCWWPYAWRTSVIDSITSRKHLGTNIQLFWLFFEISWWRKTRKGDGSSEFHNMGPVLFKYGRKYVP